MRFGEKQKGDRVRNQNRSPRIKSSLIAAQGPDGTVREPGQKKRVCEK